MPKPLKLKIIQVTSPNLQNSARDFNTRLGDFGPELGAFLKQLWKERAKINLDDLILGTRTIYAKYAGGGPDFPYDESVLKSFLKTLKQHAGKFKVEPQGWEDVTLDQLTTTDIETYGHALWTDFFHVVGEESSRPVTSRVYIHAATPNASLEIMKKVIEQFDEVGLDEVKTAGPGCNRKDTIVAYLYSAQDATDLIQVLKDWNKPKLFEDSLPPLIRKEGKGIGTADEPPGIRIDTRPKAQEQAAVRHSFGSFYSILIWLALKSTPNVTKTDNDKNAPDGRHMLDFMLYSLRLLEVNPAKPQNFPRAAKLERWYAAVVDK